MTVFYCFICSGLVGPKSCVVCKSNGITPVGWLTRWVWCLAELESAISTELNLGFKSLMESLWGVGGEWVGVIYICMYLL